jgi:SAM-dependent methyltransferase
MNLLRRYPVKRLPDGRAFINLGCGHHMHPSWNNLDFSIYARLHRHMRLVTMAHRLRFISPVRYKQFAYVAPDLLAWDLRRGIPFDDGAFDLVYHSHLLEHIDREQAAGFLGECRRVLKPGGVLRVEVPDLARWAEGYLASLHAQEAGGATADHEQIIADLLDQMVRRQPPMRDAQPRLVRFLERVLLGDSIRTGWAHRWMYDQYTLAALLERAGFTDIQAVGPGESRVAGWAEYGVSYTADGAEHKPGSLRLEAARAEP